MKKLIHIVVLLFALLLMSSAVQHQNITYEWDFGDGSPPSSEQNPAHVYTEPGTYTWTLKVTVGGQTCKKTGTITIRSSMPSQIGVGLSHLYFGSTKGSTTDSQTFSVSNRGAGTLDWRIKADAGWLDFTPYAGTDTGVVTVLADPSGLSAGTYTGRMHITDPYASNSPQEVNVILTVMDAASVTPPFGYFDTPIDGTTEITGAIPVTGWVLDDIESTKVEIWRDAVAGEASVGGLVYIGDAVFVEGARPDVEQAYSMYPLNYRAGWGYMMLTNSLPNQGNGTYIIHAFAFDREGHSVLLGTRTITCDNAHAVKPFGTIDTPGQGGDASGDAFVNFGWVLTPQPNYIPKDGSTISVWVDGVNLGHPTYNQYREDVAKSFPGLQNTDGAVGYYFLDTMQFENGVHTINWIAEDSAGNADGIGSRFFTITNTGRCCPQSGTSTQGITLDSLLPFESIMYLPQSNEPIRVRRGFESNIEPEIVETDDYGIFNLEIREVERIEFDLGKGVNAGYLAVGEKLRPLPVGSTLDKENGFFYWQPCPGFIGDYTLIFVDEENHAVKKIHIGIRPMH